MNCRFVILYFAAAISISPAVQARKSQGKHHDSLRKNKDNESFNRNYGRDSNDEDPDNDESHDGHPCKFSKWHKSYGAENDDNKDFFFWMKKGNFAQGNLTVGNCTVYSESNDENVTLPCGRLEMYDKYEQWIHNRTWNETSDETREKRSNWTRNKRGSDRPNNFSSFWEEDNFLKSSCTFHIEDYGSDENTTLPCDFFQQYERHREIWDNYNSTFDGINFTEYWESFNFTFDSEVNFTDVSCNKKRNKYKRGHYKKQQEYNGTKDNNESFFRDDNLEEENVDDFGGQEGNDSVVMINSFQQANTAPDDDDTSGSSPSHFITYVFLSNMFIMTLFLW